MRPNEEIQRLSRQPLITSALKACILQRAEDMYRGTIDTENSVG